MKYHLIITLFVALGLTISNAEKFKFDNYKLVHLNPINKEQIDMLSLFEHDPDFDVWNGIQAVNETIVVALSPKAFLKFKSAFDDTKTPYKIVEENIQKIIDEQEKSMLAGYRRNSRVVGRFARYSEIMNYLEQVESQNPDIVSSYSAGKSYENRNLKVLVIKTETSSKSIWIDCGIHAREYASVSTCVYFIDKLINDYKSGDNMALSLLKNYEFHVMPIVNPDGYEYTFTAFRLWRKNRRPNYELGSSCIGTDLNRNFAYQWMVSGSDQRPCSDIYAGPSPASEIEVQAVQNAVIKNKGNWEIFITLHSFGAYWMPPWAYTSVLPSDYKELSDLSQIAVAAIKKVSGLVFRIGTPYQTLNYAASGGSYDWAKAVLGIKYAYALELRPGANTPEANYGFMLPESQAKICGEETYAGLTALFDAIKNKTN